MRTIHTIVLHYSATYADQDIGAAEIDAMHRARGFPSFRRPDGTTGWIGYHWVIRLMGAVEAGRPEAFAGAHVRGHNGGTLGICLVGGLRRETGPNTGQDTRTEAQKAACVRLIRDIQARHPHATRVLGHRDLVATQCPGYDAGAWWAGVAGLPEPPARPAPADAPAVSSPLLRPGARGAAVARLQRALAALGQDPGPADGRFGPATAAALRAFQRQAGLVPDAVAGPATWAEIVRRCPDHGVTPC